MIVFLCLHKIIILIGTVSLAWFRSFETSQRWNLRFVLTLHIAGGIIVTHDKCHIATEIEKRFGTIFCVKYWDRSFIDYEDSFDNFIISLAIRHWTNSTRKRTQFLFRSAFLNEILYILLRYFFVKLCNGITRFVFFEP